MTYSVHVYIHIAIGMYTHLYIYTQVVVNQVPQDKLSS